MMLEMFDPSSARAPAPLVSDLDLSREAKARVDTARNLRQLIDRLIADGCAADALLVIARSLPAQYLLAWCCECSRSGLSPMNAGAEAESAAIALAEQCLKYPSDENRQLCFEFAERAGHATPGAWLATAAAWAEGSLSPAGAPAVAAPARAVAEAAVASLKLSAARSHPDSEGRLAAYAMRALTIFGTHRHNGAQT